MFSVLIFIHSILRWGILLFGVYAIVISAQRLMAKKDFSKGENLSHVLFVIFCHTQLLVGLILYFISPAVDQAFKSGAMMSNSEYRFVAVEHIATMIIAIALIQVGRTLSKKATTDNGKHKKALVFFTIGLLLILSRIPWNKALMPGLN